MDKQSLQLAAGFVSSTYVKAAEQALSSRRALVKSLLSQRRLPAEGWDDLTIEAFIQARTAALCFPVCKLHATSTVTHTQMLQDVALMDSNNFPHPVGVGEREARVASSLVARRHYGLAHGIGRSGNIAAEQPKVSNPWPWSSGHHLIAHAGFLQAACCPPLLRLRHTVCSTSKRMLAGSGLPDHCTPAAQQND